MYLMWCSYSWLLLRSSDGSFVLMNRNGRVEKKVEAHRGALISVRWDHAGTAIATGGEDGSVKVWSRRGHLRTTLSQVRCSRCHARDVIGSDPRCQGSSAVYAVSWGPDSDHVLFASGRDVTIKVRLLFLCRPTCQLL